MEVVFVWMKFASLMENCEKLGVLDGWSSRGPTAVLYRRIVSMLALNRQGSHTAALLSMEGTQYLGRTYWKEGRSAYLWIIFMQSCMNLQIALTYNRITGMRQRDVLEQQPGLLHSVAMDVSTVKDSLLMTASSTRMVRLNRDDKEPLPFLGRNLSTRETVCSNSNHPSSSPVRCARDGLECSPVDPRLVRKL